MASTATPVQAQNGIPYGAVGSQSITGLFTGGGLVNAGNLAKEHQDWLLLVGEFVFVLILSYIADTSPAAARVVVAFLIGLWLLWLTLGDGAAILNGGLKAMGLPTYNQAASGVGSVASGVA